jgi:hypothetical protein
MIVVYYVKYGVAAATVVNLLLHCNVYYVDMLFRSRSIFVLPVCALHIFVGKIIMCELHIVMRN